MVFGILVLAAGAFYAAIVVVTQVDHIFFPNSEIRLASVPGVNVLPGIDAEGTSGETASANRGNEGGRRLNILVMGLDKRPSDGEAASRTDTMFVMMIDPVSDTARGLAMPRDLWVEIPIDNTPGNFIENRINTAYAFGENGEWPGGGIAAVKRTVERLLGIEIDHHVLIDFEGFREVVNLLGGIDVEVPEPGVYDPEYSETELPGDYYPCIFEPGTYHMDGSEALCYARVRRNSNDLERIARQQLVIFAMISKATQLNFLNSPQALVNLWKQYKNTVITDISDLQAPGYADMAAKIDQSSLAFLTLGVAVRPATLDDGAQVLIPIPESVRQLVDAFLSDGRLLEENATIEVVSVEGPDGAEAAAAYLSSLGLPQSNVVASESTANVSQTEILVYTDTQYTAERIAGWLGISTERIRAALPGDEILRGTDSDILILVGSDAEIEEVPSAESGSQ